MQDNAGLKGRSIFANNFKCTLFQCRLTSSTVLRNGCALLAAVCVTAFSLSLGTAATTTEIVDRTSLRVCADPNNLPFSNKAGEGFENKIAELLGEYLSIPAEYTWFPQSQGFVRATLNDYKCDIIIGISAAHSLVLNSNPYYRSIFALVYKKNLDKTFTSLADPELKKFDRIGIVAGTSPTSLMLKYKLIDQMAPYHLFVDTREGSANNQMIKDILSEKLDAGILWGPIAGYHVGQHTSELQLSALVDDDSQDLRIAFKITMGVRLGEVKWKHVVNKFIKDKQLEVNAILEEYSVPFLND